MNLASFVEVKRNPKIPDIAPGDTVKVSARIVEGGKERVQVFQGVVIKISRGGAGANFTVRHVAFGIGVERTFPLNSSLVEKVEIVRQGKVRRSRLYYLRGLSGKEARRKIKRVERKLRQVGEELMPEAPEEVIEPVAEEAVEEALAVEAVVPAPADVKKPEAVQETAPVAEDTVEEKLVTEEAAEEKPVAVEETASQAEEETLKETPAESPVEPEKETPQA